MAAARKRAAGGCDLHFHDLRGTAYTKPHIGGLKEREIANTMVWEEENVAASSTATSVSRSAVIKDRIRCLNAAEKPFSN